MLSSGKRLELLFLASVPSMVTLLLAVLYLVPKYMDGLGNIMPLLPLMAVFYWAMLRAMSVPYWFLVLVGLVIDAMTGLPLGLSSLVYICFLLLSERLRRPLHKEGFLVKWAYMSALFLFTMALTWLLLSWYNAQAMPVFPALGQWVLTVACYPVMHRLFDFLEEHMHTRRWEILHS